MAEPMRRTLCASASLASIVASARPKAAIGESGARLPWKQLLDHAHQTEPGVLDACRDTVSLKDKARNLGLLDHRHDVTHDLETEIECESSGTMPQGATWEDPVIL